MFTDGHDQVFVDRCIERDFATLYAFRYGTRTDHAVEHAEENGSMRRVSLRALTGDEIARSYKPSTLALKPWRSVLMPDLHTLVDHRAHP